MIQNKNHGVVNFICALSSLWLGACTSLPSGTELPDASKLLQEGQAALDQGQKEKGLALLSSAAKANPGSAEAWVKIAQTQFDAENYPAAIVAADEAQKRDPQRKETKAIAVVASLRVAVRALTDMREDSNLRGTTRSEAERLARMLRETLGQDVLVPVPAAEDSRSAPARRAVAVSTPQPAANTQPTPASATSQTAPAAAPRSARKNGQERPLKVSVPPSEGGSGTSGNPFSILK